jgi:hypothetical protein
MSEEEKWVPTMSGTTTAYLPEYCEGIWVDGEMRWTNWKRLPTADGGVHGIPYPRFEGGMFRTIGLFGYEQAQALAWSYAAQFEAQLPSGPTHQVKTRVATFEFVYELKSRRTVDVEGKS